MRSRSKSTICWLESLPTRTCTLLRLTVVSLSTITSLTWDNPPAPPAGIRNRNSGASMSLVVRGTTVTESV